MTGEMVKPEKADEIRDIEYWNKVGGVGDEGILIDPNYPIHFSMLDAIRKVFPDASIEAFDVYLGPKIDIPGVGEVFRADTEGEVQWILTLRCFSNGITFDRLGLLDILVKIRSASMLNEVDGGNLTTNDIDIGNYEGVQFECPNCGSTVDYSVDREDWDKEWIYYQYRCNDCHFKYTGSYRLVELEGTVTNLE
jgi:predicted RNA-binding Zn-ribbon protein involved in translation (DUF1610 family)